MPPSAHIREWESVNGNLHRDPQLDNWQKVGDFRAQSPKWDVLIKALPLRFRKQCGREEGTTVRATGNTKQTVSSQHSRTKEHVTHRDRRGVPKTYTGLSQTKSSTEVG